MVAKQNHHARQAMPSELYDASRPTPPHSGTDKGGWLSRTKSPDRLERRPSIDPHGRGHHSSPCVKSPKVRSSTTAGVDVSAESTSGKPW